MQIKDIDVVGNALRSLRKILPLVDAHPSVMDMHIYGVMGPQLWAYTPPVALGVWTAFRRIVCDDASSSSDTVRGKCRLRIQTHSKVIVRDVDT